MELNNYNEYAKRKYDNYFLGTKQNAKNYNMKV